MATVYHKRTTVASIFQIGISPHTKYALQIQSQIAFNHGTNLHKPTITIVFIIVNITVSTIYYRDSINFHSKEIQYANCVSTIILPLPHKVCINLQQYTPVVLHNIIIRLTMI